MSDTALLFRAWRDEDLKALHRLRSEITAALDGEAEAHAQLAEAERRYADIRSFFVTEPWAGMTTLSVRVPGAAPVPGLSGDMVDGVPLDAIMVARVNECGGAINAAKGAISGWRRHRAELGRQAEEIESRIRQLDVLVSAAEARGQGAGWRSGAQPGDALALSAPG